MNQEIYIPNYNSNNCVVIQSNGVIRVYQTTPTYNSDINYKDYYVNMNYIYNEGVAHFSNYSTLPVCQTGTTNIMKRTDINNTIGITIIIIVLLINILWSYLNNSYN